MEIANHILMTVEKGGKKEKGRECGKVENIHFRFSFHEVGDLVTVWTIFFVLLYSSKCKSLTLWFSAFVVDTNSIIYFILKSIIVVE